MRAAILTVGCRLNQAESDALRARFAELGYRVVGEPAQADCCFVNTCTVTAAADRSSVQQIRRVCRLSPKPRVVVTGCLVQRAPDRVRSIPGVDELWDNARKQAELSGAAPAPVRSRALLKVQDGCDRACAYCIVARLRGSPVSVPAGLVASRLERLVQGGFEEIALTGLNIGLYRDAGGTDLAGLVSTLLERAGFLGRRVRVRLGSMEPDTVTDRVLCLFRDERVAPHIHLALQTGDDRLLSAMGRRYGRSEFAGLVRSVREARPDVCVGFDVIVGLPGEDAGSFERTGAFITELAPAYLHVFPFSARPDTRAAELAGAPADREKRRRVAELRALSGWLRKAYESRFVGTVRTAVVEPRAALTDNYLRLALETPGANRPGRLAEFLIAERGGRLFGVAKGTIPGPEGCPRRSERRESARPLRLQEKKLDVRSQKSKTGNRKGQDGPVALALPPALGASMPEPSLGPVKEVV